MNFKILFGEHFDNKFKNIKTLNYYSINPKIAIKNIKEYITFYDDRLCICMLKYYMVYNSVFSSEFKEYQGTDENEKLLKTMNGEYIGIMVENYTCTCGNMKKNNNLMKLTKIELINEINNKIREINKKNEEINKKTEKIKNLQKLDEWEDVKQKKLENFYDIIIDVNSVLKLENGWEIEMEEDGKKKYEKYREDELIVIGVIGNMNRGKSFILSKLSKIKLPSGTSINTKGISVKYPDLKDENDLRKYILLDSAGLEAPILKSENEKENSNNLKEEKEHFKLKARDILITESFLQNFIISYSNILLLVVDYLSTSEQKLINKIKEEIIKQKKDKKLFIIHNLKTYTKKEQVKKYIDEILLKSGTFELNFHEEVTSKKKEKNEGVHFTENERKYIRVYHLLFAADDSEAGAIYNNYTIDFIEGQYSDVFSKNKFDVIEKIKEKFVDISPKILTKKIEMDDFISKEEIIERKIISFKDNNKNQMTLKNCYVDELGFQFFKGNGFEPLYNFFKNDKYLEVRVELPGSVKINNIGNAIYIGDSTHLSIKGEKKKDKFPLKLEDNIDNSREFGEFNLEINFKTEEFKIKSKPIKTELKNGILYLKYELEEEKCEENNITLEVGEEEEEK